MPRKIQMRRGTAADWTSANPTLLVGERGYETDTKKEKIGDGVTAWNSLPYTLDDYAVASDVTKDTARTLSRWFAGGINGKKIVLSGDSTTVDTTQGFLPRLQYYGAKVVRPFPSPVAISRSGNTVTMTGASLFFTGDVGGTIYFTSGHSSVITAVTNAETITVADSGTIAATTGYIERNATFSASEDGPLSGVTVYHCGDNGQTAQGHLTTGVYDLEYITSLNADLYISGFGINDVRLGGCNQATLRTRLIAIIDGIRAAVPTADILLRIPNTLLTTDPGSTGFVSPLASAQDYSSFMAGAYRSIDGVYPNVKIWDTRKTVWDGDTCKATSVLMNDILHPSTLAQDAVAVDLVKIVGQPFRFQKSQADAAYAQNSTTPWEVYPKILEDDRYFELVTIGTINGSGTGYIDVDARDRNQTQNIKTGDIIFQDGASPFVSTNVSNASSVNGYFRIGMTSPVTLTGGKRVRVYRQKGFGDSEILWRLQQPTAFPFAVPIQISAAGNGFFDVNPISSIDFRHNEITDADTIVVAGVSPQSLSGASFSPQSIDGSGYMRVLLSGDHSSKSNKGGYLFGSARSRSWVRATQIGANGPVDLAGNGSPEGVVTASVGSTYRRRDGGANTCFYVKESGSGNTGWVGK